MCFLALSLGIAEKEITRDDPTVTVTLGNVTVKMTVGNRTMVVNAEEKTLDVAPLMKNDRVYLPAR